MGKQRADMAVNRLKRVLTVDKVNPSAIRLGEILKSDMVLLLNNYMELKNLSVDIKFDENGMCYINMEACSNKLKNFSVLP